MRHAGHGPHHLAATFHRVRPAAVPELAGEPGEVIRPGRDGVGQHQGEAAAVMADSPAWIQQTSPHFALFWPRWPKGSLLTSMRAAWLSIEAQKAPFVKLSFSETMYTSTSPETSLQNTAAR